MITPLALCSAWRNVIRKAARSAPKTLPPDVNAFLQGAVAKVLALPEVKKRLSEIGFDPIGGSSEQFAKYIDVEMAKYAAIIRDAKIGVKQE